MKKFLSGFIAGAVLFASIGAVAVSYVANPADFKVLVNGKEFISNPPALVVEGKTYLPLRAMGEALGVPVNWNEGLRQAEVGNTAPVAQAGNYSRTNPAPINTVQQIAVESYSGNYSAAVRVIEVIRGEAAANLIKGANMFNSESGAGKEYIVAKIAVSIMTVDGDKAIDVNKYNFKCFSGNNEEYDLPFVIAPEPELSTSLYAGGNTEGFVVFEVNKNDPAPKIAYGTKYDGSGGLWFSLQ